MLFVVLLALLAWDLRLWVVGGFAALFLLVAVGFYRALMRAVDVSSASAWSAAGAGAPLAASTGVVDRDHAVPVGVARVVAWIICGATLLTLIGYTAMLFVAKQAFSGPFAGGVWDANRLSAKPQMEAVSTP